ncbi:MAG: AAA family ATPase [Eubacterium callanderi]|nr:MULTISPECIES: AAA family ATPase [Eubacterium]
MAKTKVITISNQKDGIEKTGVRINLGVGLVDQGQKRRKI